MGVTLVALGDLALRRGETAQASMYDLRALDLYRKVAPGGLYEAETLDILADLAQRAGDLKKAEDLYRQALAIRGRLAPKGWRYAEGLAALAGIVHRQAHLDVAAQMLAEALSSLESQSGHLGGSGEIRSGFRAKHAGFYREYIGLLFSQGRLSQAFEMLEQWRARTLLEMLREGGIDVRQGADPVLLEKERSLKADLSAKSDRRIRLLSGKHTEQEAAAIDQDIEGVVSQYQEIEGQIRIASPVFAALTQPSPLDLKEIQEQLLDDKTVLLEYMLGDPHSYVFAVTRSSLDAYELPKSTEVEDAVRGVYDVVKARGYNPKGEAEIQRTKRWAAAEAAFPKAAAKLSELILKPVAAAIAGKRLVIVSDGALAYIPFAALPEPKGTAGVQPKPLVEGHEVINLPSASVLALLRKTAANRKKAPLPVAVLADPVYDQRDDRVKRLMEVKQDSAPIQMEGNKAREDSLTADLMARSADDADATRDGVLYFPRLPFSRQEADAIVSVTPRRQAMRALDFRASWQMATSPQMNQYRIVHFATHGMLDSTRPQFSGLVFSLVDERGQAQRGFLGLQDIYNMELHADLVVLSACKTALGKQIDGEGLVGLTRGFMYAGASRVMASLWNVDDAATADLMRDFYRGVLRDGVAPSAALRNAQLAMRRQKRWANPYYWAAFTIQGEWN